MKFSNTVNIQWQWTWLSATLLLVYLAFFHLCNFFHLGTGRSELNCIAIGFASWLLWLSICYYCSALFINRFEYLIHQLVGIDILLEGFNPNHDGLGFYYCAGCFWLVFLVYHFVGARRNVMGQLKPEMADAGIV